MTLWLWTQRSSGPGFGCLVLVGFLSACSSIPLRPAPQGPSQGQAALATHPVVVLADTQEHWNYGLPHGLLGGAMDRLASVTVRPAHHSLFGRQTFAYLVKQSAPMPLLHLGDVLDHSCHTELKPYLDLFHDLNEAKRPWAVVPGNHDGLFNGVLNPASAEQAYLFSRMGWQLQCMTPAQYRRFAGAASRHSAPESGGYAHGRSDVYCYEQLLAGPDPACGVKLRRQYESAVGRLHPVDDTGPGSIPLKPAELEFLRTHASKDEYLQKYAEELTGQSLPRAASVGSELTLKGTQRVNEDQPFSQIVAGHVANRRPACTGEACPQFSRSFVLQVLSLPIMRGRTPFKLLLLDTTHLLHEPGRLGMVFAGSPGDVGYVADEQIDHVSRAIASDPGAVWIFGGHHPWSNLHPAARERLQRVMLLRPHPLVYISAHTHNGNWTQHDMGKGLALTELNVGSVADWPIGARTLSFSAPEDLTWIRIHSPFRPHVQVQPAMTPAQASDALRQAWITTACAGAGEDLPAAIRKINQSVVRQREARPNWLSFIGRALTFFLTDYWERRLYLDTYNSAQGGIEALLALNDIRPALVDRLLAGVPPDRFHPHCKEQGGTSQQKLACELERVPDPKIVLADIQMTRRAADQVQGLLAEVHESLLRLERQDRALSHNDLAAMACVHVLAAAADYEEDPDESASDQPVRPCQFASSAVAPRHLPLDRWRELGPTCPADWSGSSD